MIALFVHELAITKILAEQCAILSKSWSYLFTTYGYGDNESGSRGARSYPTSYVYPGIYYWATGKLYYQSLDGSYWSSSITSSTNSYYIGMNSTRLVKSYTYYKYHGLPLRCIIRLAQRIELP